MSEAQGASDGRWRLRPGQDADKAFIERMTPRLAAQGKLPWHDKATILAFQRAYIAESLRDAAEDGLYLVAEDERGRPVGLAIAIMSEDEISGEAAGLLRILAVDESAEGQGLASELMRAVEDWARGRGWRLLLLDVFAANGRAQNFYARRGFAPDYIRMVATL